MFSCKHSMVTFLLVSCFALETPDNGMIECTGFQFEDTCTFTCDPGYELSGSSTRTCQSDAMWNGTDATCVQGTLILLTLDIIHDLLL